MEQESGRTRPLLARSTSLSAQLYWPDLQRALQPRSQVLQSPLVPTDDLKPLLRSTVAMLSRRLLLHLCAHLLLLLAAGSALASRSHSIPGSPRVIALTGKWAPGGGSGAPAFRFAQRAPASACRFSMAIRLQTQPVEAMAVHVALVCDGLGDAVAARCSRARAPHLCSPLHHRAELNFDDSVSNGKPWMVTLNAHYVRPVPARFACLFGHMLCCLFCTPRRPCEAPSPAGRCFPLLETSS